MVFLLNSNWRNRPTSIDFISKEVKWVVGIDESGNPNLKQVEKAVKNNTAINLNEKHFVVTACVMKTEDFEGSRDMVMNIKHKYWEDALYMYNGTEKRICFHSREIRGRKDGFSPRLIEYGDFITDLSQCLGDLSLTLYSSYIDKEAHVKKYSNPKHPYDLCMTFILERILMRIPRSEDCIVVLESRGKREDSILLNQIKELIDNGNFYKDKSFFKRIKGVYFNQKWSKVQQEKQSYWILELADLYAYPIYKYFTHSTKDKAFETLEPKIYGYPNISGHGLKVFP
ncbi:conserved hypothetical protein [Bacillus thuringiensis str. Al Hakam]|nr:conserved hypothetical protein [Bacillus thuringiensis str. Al Hakam]PGV80294.1 DUF3800 domain-containing protein [Bacillus thuringiensis]